MQTYKIWPTFNIRMKVLGFSCDQTGGGCRAYIKALDDTRYVMVTDREGCGVDRIGPDNWLVGLYDENGEVSMHYADGGSIDAALRAVGVQI